MESILVWYFATISSGTFVQRLTITSNAVFTTSAQIKAENPSGGVTRKVKMIATIRPDTVPATAPSLVAFFQNNPATVAGRI